MEPLLPSMAPQRGGRWRHPRQVIDGILWPTENGAKWHQVPDRYGPWKTCYHRFSVWEQDGTWARVEEQLQAQADAVGGLDGRAQADSTIVRAHQNAAGARTGGSARRESGAAQGIGRSRGGLTTKLHMLADGHGRPLVTRITPGRPPTPRNLSRCWTASPCPARAAEAGTVNGWTT